jgi:hypothetical protein
MNRGRFLVGLAFGFLLAAWTSGIGQAASGRASITGTVLDATAGAPLPTGLVARLREVPASQASVPRRSASVDARGGFSFDDVSIDSSIAYTVGVEYGGATYETAIPAEGLPTVPLVVTIYEPTTSDATLQIDAATWVVESIDPDNQQLTILETIVLNNAGDRTFVGDHHGDPGSDAPGVLPRSLRILLPPGASGFTAQLGIDSSTTLPVANGVVDTQPILPGLHQIGYTYNIAYSEGGAEIRKAMPYATRRLRFLGPNAGLDLRSDRLVAAGSVQIANRPFLILAADDVPANSEVTVDIFGLPSSPVGRLDANTIQVAGLVVVLLAILMAVYLAFRPSRSAAAEAEAERQSLVATIASLDDAYASGKLPDEIYRAERDRHKRQLVDLMVGDRRLADRPGGQR